MDYDPVDAEVMEQVRDLLREGKKINAIKLVVDNSDLGLKDAKAYVDELERRMR